MSLAAAPQLPAGATVLVTGAAGLLGRAVASRLTSLGNGARLLVRRREQARDLPEDAQVVVGDVNDPASLHAAIEGTDVVLHLAATTRGSADEFERTNVQGTRNVVDGCLRAATCRLVHVSSLSVLDHAGREPGGRPLREDAPLEPFPARRGHYTQTKLAAELVVRQAMESRGLKAVILRPGQILGPGCEAVPPNGVAALRGWNLVGNGSARLPLVYAEDVVDALLLAAFRGGVEGGTYNIVDTTPVTQNEYLAAWRKRVPEKPLRRIPEPLALGVAAIIECVAALAGRQAPLTRYRVRSLRPLAGFDTTLASSVLGWQPRVGVARGLELCFGTSLTAAARP
jgi:nucleoside-diphosphate-sugar epimerase